MMGVRRRIGVATGGFLVCLMLSGCWPWEEKVVTVPPSGETETVPPGGVEPLPEPSPDKIVDPPVPPPASGEYPVARKVPGREGMVFSPYNNRLLSVEGLASGILVSDPQYPAAEKRYFRVP